jgi:hypothetical protein
VNRRFQALGRLPVGTMNRTEELYALELQRRIRIGEVLWYRFEGVKLRLADNTFYSPDFAVLVVDPIRLPIDLVPGAVAVGQLEMHEVKGHWQDDARVKIKVAAEQYPFAFVAVKALPKSKGGGWETEVFGG